MSPTTTVMSLSHHHSRHNTYFFFSFSFILDCEFLHECDCLVVFYPQTHAHTSLVYLVSLLGNMEHTFHHTLLLEIRALTDRYPSLLGGCSKDIYRLSNSFTAIARLLGRRLEESSSPRCRSEETCLIHQLAEPEGIPRGWMKKESNVISYCFVFVEFLLHPLNI